MNPGLQGRIVAVSGAALGFGRAIAKGFRASGAKVFGCDLRADELHALTGEGVVTNVVNLTDRAAARSWIADIEQAAGAAVDILINNAGGVAGQAFVPIEQVDDRAWNAVLDINLGAAFALSQACVPGMTRVGRGAIVNISSGAALRASQTGVQAYCAAKHALLGLTRQLAHELGPRGIRVNSVAPGFVITGESTQRQWQAYGPQGQKALIEKIALRRLGTPEDIANAVLFLASDQARFVNGQVLEVNGGH